MTTETITVVLSPLSTPERKVLLIDGNPYVYNPKLKEVQAGTILYDLRMNSIIVVETEDDAYRYAYVAPEMYVVLVPMDK